ncbi:sodium:solute symporter [Crocinitomicaceae bacterium]|nr:sodium:solute symporter [Crocinitomicaceae bacterium]
MSAIDWVVLFGTLGLIVAYGSWKTRKNKNLESYLKGNNAENWMTIGLSIMATQASAITFLSTPGQAYESGMGFVQFYFGLPLAMVIISIFFLPIYYRLKVYTAYQYLEDRFDSKVRSFTAFLFLMSRGLAAGITIYAPAIILSTLLEWNLQLTCLLIGLLVIIYTVSGGSRAVSLTQKWQMAVIMVGMFFAFYYVLDSFPTDVDFSKGVDIAGQLGKMNIIDTSFDVSNRYTIWSGLFGGLFLFLSYFGTDQSQVQRYLGGKSLKASRMGLMMNGILKIPMQFFILLIGVMVFVSFQYNKPPIVFNQGTIISAKIDQKRLEPISAKYDIVHGYKRYLLSQPSVNEDPKLMQTANIMQGLQSDLRDTYKAEVVAMDPDYEKKDADYIFLHFVLTFLPAGLIGLLLAVIFSAAMSSTAGELNALASTTTIDFYRKYWARPDTNEKKDLKISRWLTVGWGILAILVALTAGLVENLIELVNILGSLFYGTILGVFLVAFFFKRVGSTSVLIAAIIGQVLILTLHLLTVIDVIELSYLHYNIIASVVVILTSMLIESLTNQIKTQE